VLLHVRPLGTDEAPPLLLMVLHCVMLMLMLLPMPLLPPPAVNYTASEVASSEHAVMQGNRTWTLYSAQADYAAAADICSSQGLQLVSVHSADDNAALAALAAQYPNWSAGLAVGGALMLGLRFNATAQAYVWQDGTDVDWWPESSNLTTAPPGLDCMAVTASSGTWQPVSCTRVPASFVCQNSTPSSMAPCAAGFHIVDGACVPCAADSWCAGGSSAAVPCGEGLGTVLRTAPRQEACGERRQNPCRGLYLACCKTASYVCMTH
jgi:hypothetical protein